MTDELNKSKQDFLNKTQKLDENFSQILSYAQTREDAPVEVKNRVKHQVKVHWQENTKKRKKHDFWYMLGSLATALSVFIIVIINSEMLQTESVSSDVYLERAQGQVKTSDSGLLHLNNASKMLASGTMIETMSNGYATLSLKTGGNLRLNHNSQIIVNSNNEFTLSFGTVYFDSGISKKRKSPITIHTLHGQIQDIGTQFSVTSHQENIKIRVREGLVNLNNEQGVQSLEAGYQLTGKSEGIFEKTMLSPRDKEWNWVNNAAPEFDLEGKSLYQFLIWLSREHALKLVFSQSHIEKLSQFIILHGDVKDLNLQQALLSVFSTTELKYLIEKNKLKVFK
ncbi:FecR family protein [Pseudoalteromonas denitrificans]|jgi:hypothetical protein|uniref:FecR family protein n=1 Tax=Pseudoalteromonas denitrificans DSM 6059 TaxID=1123010 RepID=A0A1I1TXW7_9GAMM|nr:FecR family protein [Pseudoalteromonas denitrificans]SFD63442.1 FecR family protein [Pseudoalteromonas denitrificans DSM 6059]